MLIATMNTCDETVQVSTTADTDMEIAVVVTASVHAGLIGHAKVPAVITMPETLLGDMTGIGIILPLVMEHAEELPGIMIPARPLVSQCGIKAALIRDTGTQHQMVSVLLGRHTTGKQK